MKLIKPYLLFVGDQAGKAQEAITFYTTLFDNSEILHIERYGAEESEPQGTIKLARFTLNGIEYMAEDSSLSHKFTFTPAISLFIVCETLEELETLYKALSDGGQELVPLYDNGINQNFSWINDKYGVSWQLNFANNGELHI